MLKVISIYLIWFSLHAQVISIDLIWFNLHAEVISFQPSVFELAHLPEFPSLPLIPEDFIKDHGGKYTSKYSAVWGMAYFGSSSTFFFFCLKTKQKHLAAYIYHSFKSSVTY